MKRVWCVEDEASIRDIVVYTLESTGYEARGFEGANEFWEAVKEQKPDLVLLDIMLPESDGMQILRDLRNGKQTAHIPVIMTTAKGMESDKIRALEQGADDYLVKPFGMMEMAARIKAVLRRCTPAASESAVGSLLRSGNLELDEEAHNAWLKVDGNAQKLDLTRKEFDLLGMFMSSPGRTFSRDDLMMEVWGTDFAGETRTVDVHIRTLRQKLGEEGKRIETVRGIGYRLGDPQ